MRSWGLVLPRPERNNSCGVQLLLDRDPHGNVQVAKIETEVLLAHAVEAELDELAAAGGQNVNFIRPTHRGLCHTSGSIHTVPRFESY